MKRTRSVGVARYKIVFGAALTAAVLGMSACGPLLAGSAAVVGTQRITDQTLYQQVTEVTTALDLAETPQVSAVILGRLVTQQLVSALAQQQHVTVDNAEVDRFIADQVQAAGGRPRFESALIRKGIPADQIPAAARATLYVIKLGPILAPNGDQQAQDLAIVAAVSQLSNQLGTRVSPRFGEWNAELLQIGPPPNDLSVPVRKVSIDPLQGAAVQ